MPEGPLVAGAVSAQQQTAEMRRLVAEGLQPWYDGCMEAATIHGRTCDQPTARLMPNAQHASPQEPRRRLRIAIANGKCAWVL